MRTANFSEFTAERQSAAYRLALLSCWHRCRITAMFGIKFNRLFGSRNNATKPLRSLRQHLRAEKEPLRATFPGKRRARCYPEPQQAGGLSGFGRYLGSTAG